MNIDENSVVLHNRVRLIADGTPLVEIVDRVGRSFGKVDARGSQPCPQCAHPVGVFNRHAIGVVVRGNRVHHHVERTFCSMACRDVWWMSGSDVPLFRVDTPATLDRFLCHHCQGGHAYSTLVGVGDVCPRVDESARELVVTNQSEEELSRHALVSLDPCDGCTSVRMVSPAPFFFHAEPGDFGWCDRWAKRLDYDRDLRVTVFEAALGEIQYYEHTLDESGRAVIRMLPEIIREQWEFGTPHDLNRWWMAPIAPDERDRVRSQFRELARA